MIQDISIYELQMSHSAIYLAFPFAAIDTDDKSRFDLLLLMVQMGMHGIKIEETNFKLYASAVCERTGKDKLTDKSPFSAPIIGDIISDWYSNYWEIKEFKRQVIPTCE